MVSLNYNDPIIPLLDPFVSDLSITPVAHDYKQRHTAKFSQLPMKSLTKLPSKSRNLFFNDWWQPCGSPVDLCQDYIHMSANLLLTDDKSFDIFTAVNEIILRLWVEYQLIYVLWYTCALNGRFYCFGKNILHILRHYKNINQHDTLKTGSRHDDSFVDTDGTGGRPISNIRSYQWQHS